MSHVRFGSTAAKDPSWNADSGPGQKAVIQIAGKTMFSMAENGQRTATSGEDQSKEVQFCSGAENSYSSQRN